MFIYVWVKRERQKERKAAIETERETVKDRQTEAKREKHRGTY